MSGECESFEQVTCDTTYVSSLTVHEVVEYLKSQRVRDGASSNFSLVLFADGSSSVVVFDHLPHNVEVWGFDRVEQLSQEIRGG